jgi:hypothetical protein
MDNILLLASLDENTALFVSPLSAEALEDSGMAPNDSALFLYESVNTPDFGGIRVLAQVSDLDAAYRLADMFRCRGAA